MGREARIGAVVPSAATPPSPPAAPACTHHTVFCALLLPPATRHLVPATCNLQSATCNLQPRTPCTGAGSPSSGFATTSWQECLLFFCTLLLHGVLGGSTTPRRA